MNTPNERYDAAKKFADVFNAMPRLWQKVLGELLILGDSEDEIADRLGQEVVRDKDGCPLATHSIDRVKNEAYGFLAHHGYNREDVAHYLDEMGAYRL